jgi:glycosyltransferase involved in cell wall biosynthesis
VITFIKACDLALRTVDLEISVIGPTDEDPAYADRCRALVVLLGRADKIRFIGAKQPEQLYEDLDVCVLTSFSEGQPLVILEAGAAGVPVVATDVGACREMLEGSNELEDAELGPGGIVTRVASPEDTAAALVRLATDPDLRRTMGQAGRARACRSYAKSRMIDTYRELYRTLEASN